LANSFLKQSGPANQNFSNLIAHQYRNFTTIGKGGLQQDSTGVRGTPTVPKRH
jgi:hypothetical protein